ncbi:amidohydrolase family protein [Streptomyces sp. NBC_01310]|uniref:amidohydrolase family protein n=1 Tax=Streptomyces sp. NBC_01310 TaxID=2903820 RepID=UPI0035B57FEE
MQAVITAGRMVTGPGGQETADGAVFVEKGVITAAGPRAEVEAQAGPAVPRLAFPRGTLLPGLIDTHVHLALDAGPDPVGALRAATDTELYRGMAERAGRLLATGVTTVRDLGDRGGLAVRLRDEIAGGRLPGPRVLAAGTPLTGPGGHCWSSAARSRARTRSGRRSAVTRRAGWTSSR